MVNKKAWLRILEATIALMLVSGVLLFIYSKEPTQNNISEQVYEIQKNILFEISINNTLRNATLSDDNKTLIKFVNLTLTPFLDFEIKICNLTLPGETLIPCKMSLESVTKSYKKDVYVQEIIIASQIEIQSKYSPRKIKFFVWEK